MPARINLNTATADELRTLSGIGRVLADRIIEYRSTIGRFHTVAELAAISGITSELANSLENEVTVANANAFEELPNLVVEIRLENAGGEPYTGHRVVAQFTKREQVSSASEEPEILLCHVDISVDLDDEGVAELPFPNPENLQGDIRFRFLAPDGEVLRIAVVAAENLGQQMTFEVDPKTFFDIEPNEDPSFGKPDKLRGRVVDASGRVRISAKQVVIWGATAENPSEADYRALIVTETSDTGYFSGPYPVGEFTAAFGTVALGDEVEVPIHLEEDNTFPDMILLVLEDVSDEDHDASRPDQTVVPRLPDNQDLVLAQGTFSQDIVPGQCVDFTKPNRVLEEFSFSYVLRTTEPEIKGLTLDNTFANLSSETVKLANANAAQRG